MNGISDEDRKVVIKTLQQGVSTYIVAAFDPDIAGMVQRIPCLRSKSDIYMGELQRSADIVCFIRFQWSIFGGLPCQKSSTRLRWQLGRRT